MALTAKTTEAGAPLEEYDPGESGRSEVPPPQGSTCKTRLGAMNKINLKSLQGGSFLFLILRHRHCKKMKIS
jgi:hypothetical protein